MQVKGGTAGKQAIVYTAAFAVSLAIGMVNLSIVFYAKDILGLAPAQVGFLAAMWCASYALVCLVSRKLHDLAPPRFLIAGSLAMMALFVFAVLAAPSALWVFPFYALFGASMALFWSPLVGWLSVGAEGGMLNRLTARFNMSWSAGAIASPYATGRLYEWRPDIPLQAGGGILLATALFVGLVSMLLPNIRSDRSHRPEHALGRKDFSTAYRFPAWIGLGATYFGMGILTTVFPLASRSEAGFSETQVGKALLVFGLCNFAGFFLLGRMKTWHFRVFPMATALSIRACAFLVLASARTLGPIAGLMAVLGFTLSMAYTASIFHGASGSLYKAKRMAIHETVISSSVVAGVLFGGMLYQAHSARAVYGIVALISGGAAVAQAVCAKKISVIGEKHWLPAGNMTE